MTVTALNLVRLGPDQDSDLMRQIRGALGLLGLCGYTIREWTDYSNFTQNWTATLQ